MNQGNIKYCGTLRSKQTTLLRLINLTLLYLINKESKDCYIIDIACPFDKRIDHTTKEKLEKYQDLRRELKRLWKCKTVKIVPIIIGALRTVQKSLKEWLVILDIPCDIELLQRVCLLGIARIVRRVLET